MISAWARRRVNAEVIPGRAKREPQGRNCALGNLEIPGLVLAHHPGMTTFGRHFFTSGHAGSGGPNASSPEILARIL